MIQTLESTQQLYEDIDPLEKSGEASKNKENLVRELEVVEHECEHDSPGEDTEEALEAVKGAFKQVFLNVNGVASQVRYEETTTLAKNRLNGMLAELPTASTEDRERLETTLDYLARFEHTKEDLLAGQRAIAQEIPNVFKPMETCTKTLKDLHEERYSRNSNQEEQDPKQKAESLDQYLGTTLQTLEDARSVVVKSTVRGRPMTTKISEFITTTNRGIQELTDVMEVLEIQKQKLELRGDENGEIEVKQILREIEEMKNKLRPKLLEMENGESEYVAKGSRATEEIIGIESKYEARKGRVGITRQQIRNS